MAILDGASVLLTGGTGSFAQAFVAAVYRDYHPRRIILFSRDEYKQSVMRQKWPDSDGSPFRYLIGDVRSLDRLIEALQGVDYVIHTAAMKRVESCDYNPFEAMSTNVLGTANVIQAALHTGVRRVVVLSSDKSCSPVLYYGATKAMAEHLTVLANAHRGQRLTRLSCVRYGNVLGSRGSVLHLFREQAKCGEVTITHPDMSRFFITLSQAAAFVISCLETMEGGEIFVPKLPSMMIRDMALAVAPGAKLRFIGMRTSEKVAELMVSGDEAYRTVELPGHYVILPANPYWPMTSYDGMPRMPEGWQYASSASERSLTAEELLEMANASV